LVNRNKNIANTTENNNRQALIFMSLLLMIASVFISRATVSSSFILFLALTLIHKGIAEQLKAFTRDPLLMGMALLFFIPFISGLWSSDINHWKEVMQLKLPFLFFPIAFAGRWTLTEKQWRMTAFFLVISLVFACFWSLGQYLLHYSEVNESIRRAKLMDTPLENDHVRFSWLVSIGVITGVLLLRLTTDKLLRVLLVAATLFFIFYLHVLSARTGLLCFYLFTILVILWQLFRIKSLWKGSILLIILILLPFVAWLTIPSFQKRLDYLLYDFSFVKSGTYVRGSNDGARVFSINAGTHILATKPFGVGAGDVLDQADNWYNIHVPSMVPQDRLYPSSEWLIYAAYSGWIGLLVFSAIMILPFFKKTRHSIFWIGLNIVSLFSFAFDIGLEVQYGIFLYCLLLLWWYKWLKQVTVHEQ
jgi:O-antigen ligase